MITVKTSCAAWIAAAVAGLIAAAPAVAADAVEKPDLKLGVGGKPLLYYLPLTLVERLGYFKDEGLKIEIQDFAGGAKSLQALIGGSVDIVTGSYEHTIQMQAQGKPLIAVVDLGRFPGIALGITKKKAADFKSMKDLKGMKIGVTAPGSSTNFMVSYLMIKNGLKPEDASFIGVGGSSTAVAAVRHGDIDAISNLDPVISELESKGEIVIVADSRTAKGAEEIYGGLSPAAVLYTQPDFVAKNPKTTQALVNAFVRGLKYIQSHTPEQIADVMPPDFYLGDKNLYITALKASIAIYSPDGKLSDQGGQNTLNVLKVFDPKVQEAKIDIAKTYTNAYVEKALATVKP